MGGKHSASGGKNTGRKNLKPVILAAVLGAIVIAACVGAYFIFFGGESLSESRVKKDIKNCKALTTRQVGEYELSFEVTEINLDSGSIDSTADKVTAKAEVVVENNMYRESDIDVSIEYVKSGGGYKIGSEKAQGDFTLAATGGFDEDLALKYVKDKYKKASLRSHKTDLENGRDIFEYNVTTSDEKGTVKVTYKFDDRDGWVASGINDDKLELKKGKTGTVDVDGVKCYTNSAVRNIILFGTDADDGACRSDSMILVSIDSNSKEIKLSSFMRDTYVDIDGYGKDKLNAAYAYGGAALAVKTIEKNYGIKIDNYISTGFSNFKNIIDALGGVEIQLDEDECGYINWQLAKNGQTASAGAVEVKDGVQRLNGQQMLWLCRDRGSDQFSGNDFTRTSRQRRLMKTLVSAYKESSASQVLELARSMEKYIKTDLDTKDIKWLAKNSPKFFKYKTSERCYPRETSGWSAGTSPAGAWIISMDNWDETKKDISRYIYEDLK